MNLKNIFNSINMMNEEEAKAFISSRTTDSYQLVDVRQPSEYKEGHLPGAHLVPLNVLTAGAGDLDPIKPTIVYCRSGGRSQAASQFLVGQGFREVYDIGASIISWLGIRVTGPYEANLHLIDQNADFPDAWTLAYAMEEGLQRFYLKLERLETKDKFKGIFNKLAKFEDLHKEKLIKAHAEADSQSKDLDAFIKEHGELIEGGNLDKNSPMGIISELKDPIDIFGLAMAIETRSFDLYARLAYTSINSETKKLFVKLADEEKAHLDYITKEMDTVLSA